MFVESPTFVSGILPDRRRAFGRLVACSILTALAVLWASIAAAQPEPRPKKRGRKYRVRIDSAPQRAAVYLDDKKYGIVGYTPWEGRLEKGDWIVILDLDGYEESTKTIRVNRTRRLQETFVPLVKVYQHAVLDVRSDADPKSFGAEVWLDGQLQGQIPVLLKAKEGRHLIEIKKEGYQVFAQWVDVKQAERVQVNPVLKALKKEALQGGQIRVLANVEGARVLFDGTDLGEVPLDVKDVRPGEHVIEVHKEGFRASEQRTVVESGAAIVLKFDLLPAGVGPGAAMVQIVSPEPEAEVFVDGKSLGLVPQSVPLSPGEHFVVVQKPGFAKFESRIQVEEGKTQTVTAKLLAVGKVRFLSSPIGAQVLLDGVVIGKTPLVREDVEVGDHSVVIRSPNHAVYEQSLSVEGGKLHVVNARLSAVSQGPTPRQMRKEQRGLTSFGARVLPRGRSTVDLSVGYPYYFQGRFTVGAGNLGGQLGFDASVMMRTYFSRTDIGLSGRLTLIDQDPFSLGAFTTLGGGSTFFDDSSRGTIFGDFGVMGSLSGLGNITVTGRGYIRMWSDRHCPGLTGPEGSESIKASPIKTCEQYLERSNGGNPEGLSADDLAHIDRLLDGSPFEREFGLRFMASLLVEVVYTQRWNLWFLFEGAPFQGERAAFTNFFSGLMFSDDFGTYFRFGATYKF